MADLKDFSCFRTSTTLHSSFIISLSLLVVALRVKLKVAERRGEQFLKAWFPCDLETQWANGLRHFSHENRVKQTWHVYSRLINGHICLWWLGLLEYIPCRLTRTDCTEVKLKETETLRRLGVKPSRTDSNSVFSRGGRE